MAAYISFQPSDFFNPVLYTGTGSELTVTGVGFQPDWTWIKCRNAVNHQREYDAVRGANVVLYPNLSSLQYTLTQELKSWTSDGFVMGTEAEINTNTNTYVGWNWKAGTTTGIAGSPSITPTAYSFNATSGFSIITYTGDGVAGGTVPHGLGVAPKFIIVKRLDGADNWMCYSSVIGNTKYLSLDTTAAEATWALAWNDTSPTSTLFSLGTQNNTNTYTYVAYCFTDIKGYSKFGSYEGNGNADGTFVYTGFRPAFVLGKITDGTDSWHMWDNKRDPSNVVERRLEANSSGAEHTSIDWMDFVSNGFKHRYGGGGNNNAGSSYIYAAFAEFPFVSSNSIPTVAR